MKIELQHIHKSFGQVHANNDITLTFESGQIVGVLGENGAGKSTLMKILSGYQRADRGTILLDGAPAQYHTPLAAIQSGIGMLQQDPLDVPALTVIENFIYGQPGGALLSIKQAEQQLSAICQRLGFSLQPNAPVFSLSISQRQQLEIARLIALGVRALILDEPTTGISAEQKTLLFNALRTLAKRDSVTILLVSHKLEDVLALCDEVVVLRAGTLVGNARLPVPQTELVRMMFGQVFAPQERPDVPLGNVVAALNNVTLRGKRVTVSDLNLDIRAGEVIGIAGLDGSGQELVLRAFTGLVKPRRGQVLINGENVTGKSYVELIEHGIAFGAAGRLEEGLIAGLTLTEHMALVKNKTPFIRWDIITTLTQNLLKEYDVRGGPQDFIERLSGGNQQRVLIALMPEGCTLMALEQPTRGLDVDSARKIWGQIMSRRDRGTAILFTSPELDELLTYSDRVFVAYAGHLYDAGDAKTLTIDVLGRLIGGDFNRPEAVAH